MVVGEGFDSEDIEVRLLEMLVAAGHLDNEDIGVRLLLLGILVAGIVEKEGHYYQMTGIADLLERRRDC